MNTANLQLEGLYMALVALLGSLKAKGLLSEGDIETALADAERDLSRELERRDLSQANLQAVVFPIRLLRRANADPDSFASLARSVGTGPAS